MAYREFLKGGGIQPKPKRLSGKYIQVVVKQKWSLFESVRDFMIFVPQKEVFSKKRSSL